MEAAVRPWAMAVPLISTSTLRPMRFLGITFFTNRFMCKVRFGSVGNFSFLGEGIPVPAISEPKMRVTVEQDALNYGTNLVLDACLLGSQNDKRNHVLFFVSVFSSST